MKLRIKMGIDELVLICMIMGVFIIYTITENDFEWYWNALIVAGWYMIASAILGRRYKVVRIRGKDRL